MHRQQAGWANFPSLVFVFYATLTQNQSTPNLPRMAGVNLKIGNIYEKGNFIFFVSFLSACAIQPTTEENSIDGRFSDAIYRVESSGFIGCAPSDISISNVVDLALGMSEAWVAECKN